MVLGVSEHVTGSLEYIGEKLKEEGFYFENSMAPSRATFLRNTFSAHGYEVKVEERGEGNSKLVDLAIINGVDHE